ncbi:hypothetical protein ACFHWD_05900 [Clostridium sp. MT-14]|jgi:hypothetical protein|uniref:Uncharacterized protein n=1 Tax=Clostridium aromativorans TaxID=2836848 RepID=A0ABS8N2G2_9CLOT|nr:MULTISPECIES: hypothetical protein [Clostridium]KAA8675204.1 hypothetical protein F3O63_05390 [Clostridium sp. HV4-5-A1G]MCC9293996.1 hypothetical protein [Clostridium aromativorans]CAB1242115.1 conserved hypothetical protein [Clostridiaceae bacterium BL-3]
MKEVFDFLSDRKLLIGVGIGILLATFIMSGVKIQYQMSKSQIEDKARSMGMQYPDEMKVINSGGENK